MTPPARYAPRLEVLEDRLVPALTIREVNGVLRIKGDDHLNDFITIGDTGGSVAGPVTVIANGQFRLSRTPITRIRIDTGGGRDTVQYSLLRNLISGQNRRIDIDTGSDLDTVTINLAAGLQANSSLRLTARLGSGNDQFL